MSERSSQVADSAVGANPPSASPPPPERSLGTLAGRGALWAAMANITMRFASVAITAVLARLLSKEDFGVFAVALAVYLVVASLAELGMASAIGRSPHEPDDIAPTVASISIFVSGAIGLLMAVFAPVLASALGQPAAATPLRILSLCIILTGLFAVPSAQLVREFRQDRIFLATIAGFIIANPILVVFAINGGGATAFAWSRVIGQLVTGLVMVLATSKRYRPGWRRSAVAPLLRFGLPLSIANLVNWSLLNADYLVLGRMVDAATVGVYMIAFNVANWSTAVMGSVLNSVVVPAFGRAGNDRARLGAALVLASELVALLAFPVGAMTLALASPIIRVIFGPKWTDAIPVLAVLSLYGVLYAFSLLYANVLVATGKTLRLLLIQLSWVAVLVPAIVIGLHLRGLEGVAWAHVITIGLIAVPAYAAAVVGATDQRALRLLRSALRSAVSAAFAACGAWLTSQAFDTQLLSLMAGALVGGLLYLVTAGSVIVRRLRFVPSSFPAQWRRSHSRGISA